MANHMEAAPRAVMNGPLPPQSAAPITDTEEEQEAAADLNTSHVSLALSDLSNHNEDAANDNNNNNNSSNNNAPATTSAAAITTPRTNRHTITKERRSRPSSNLSTSIQSSGDSSQPGIVHVDEIAPNLNNRFYRGLTRPGARARLREERAASRRAAQQQQQQQTRREVGEAAAANNTNGSHHNNSSSSSNNNLYNNSSDENIISSSSGSNRRVLFASSRNITHQSNSSSQSARNLLLRRNSNNDNEETTANHQAGESNNTRRLTSDSTTSEDNNNSFGMSRRNIFAVVSHAIRRGEEQPAAATGTGTATSTTATAGNVDTATPAETMHHNEEPILSATLVEEPEIFFATQIIDDDEEDTPPDSEVERIVQRLEVRNANRVSVPLEVKKHFLRMCNEARMARLLSGVDDGGLNGSTKLNESIPGGLENESLTIPPQSPTAIGASTTSYSSKQQQQSSYSPCILRADIIQIRNTIRLKVDSRTKLQRIQDGIKSRLGFKCHAKLLLNVLNRAVDLIDYESFAAKNKALERKKTFLDQQQQQQQQESQMMNGATTSSGTAVEETEIPTNGVEEEEEWFYYKDFAFYHLKLESKYPWIRNAIVFAAMITFAFYLFTPILWCVILSDPNICPESNYHGWLNSLFFASATMATVGYGDVTVFVGSEDGLDTPDPEPWRVFIAILFMIVSLIVSVIGFQAGLDSQFHLFRRRLDVFGKRVYEILRDARIVYGKDRYDKHDEMAIRIWWSKFSQLAEICLVFIILNLVGVFAVQIAVAINPKDNFGNDIEVGWMTSLYWAVQTTTTIGYGDVDTPENLRWFMLIYLGFGTYFVGSALGKLSDLSKKLESIRLLYLWQQQEASFTMLRDFSGKEEDAQPEIDQFEFTIASLVLLGKITRDDVRPILQKFKELSGDSNKITSFDVSGPNSMKNETEDTNNDEEGDDGNEDEEGSQTGGEDEAKRSSVLGVGKKIAKAFREEILTGSNERQNTDATLDDEDENEIAPDYTQFCIPKNTFAIAIDDSKIQRKLLGKMLDFAGIAAGNTTIVGDGYDEIMGFEDYVVNFVENHTDDYIFLIVDENLDVVDDASNSFTISGSSCVEKIRNRLPPHLERRMFALIRSANDSSSDMAIYNARAHGFLPKAPIKRDKVVETLAPLWLKRFPPSEFGETVERGASETKSVASEDVACSPYEIMEKLSHIDSLFENNENLTDVQIRDQMRELKELKSDLLTLNSSASLTSIIGDINLILVAQCRDTIMETWRSVRDRLRDIVTSMEKNFRIPSNTFAIAIDDSKIQRKLLGKLFDFIGIPSEKCTLLGDTAAEITGFEDFVIRFMEDHRDDYVLLIVDEQLDIVNESSQHESISGSNAVESIRKRLPADLEKRMLAVIRSANDSTTEIATFQTRAHAFLAKAPIRREKVNETLAPLWLKRFPPSIFGDACWDDGDGGATTAALSTMEELACTPEDIAQKLAEIDSLFQHNVHSSNWQTIHDQMHMLKGDLLTMNSVASNISILGMINLMLMTQDEPDIMLTKWTNLKDKLFSIINNGGSGGGKSATKANFARWGRRRNSAVKIDLPPPTTTPLKRSMSKNLTSSFVSNVSGLTDDSKEENKEPRSP